MVSRLTRTGVTEGDLCEGPRPMVSRTICFVKEKPKGSEAMAALMKFKSSLFSKPTSSRFKVQWIAHILRCSTWMSQDFAYAVEATVKMRSTASPQTPLALIFSLQHCCLQ